MKMNCNCCDGIYNSYDIHFTSACDNKCAHCIDVCFNGFGINKPNIEAIVKTIIDNANGLDDILFLGGEPCLYIDELLACIKLIREKTNLKIYVTTSIPKICYDKKEVFYEIINVVDGINLSVQHYKEDIADEIRKTKSQYDRQTFYSNLPNKQKIRININIVKPFLYEKGDIVSCLKHYDAMGFNSIKLSEIQHGKGIYVSFEKVFNLKMKSAYSNSCQNWIDMDKIIPGFKTSLLLKRSCFICEESLKATLSDGIKVIAKLIKPSNNKYGVVYENGKLTKGWV